MSFFMFRAGRVWLCSLFIMGLSAQMAQAESVTPAMSNARLEMLIKRVDPAAQGEAGYWRLHIHKQPLLVITDEKADRMRIISPVARAQEVKPDLLLRLMQANFDSALDARYAIAKHTLWSAFIHPLRSLSDEEFLAALGQVTNLVKSYGSSYSSGALIFRGGDSQDLQPRKLIDELLEKGLSV